MDTLVAALLGAILIIVFTRHGGVGISPDSIYYKSAADSFLQGQGFYQFDDSPLILFPLFYPSFLALIQFIFRQDMVLLAPYVNGILFGTTIFISGSIVDKMHHGKWIKWILLLTIVVSPCLLEIYTMLWSESLFIIEILLFFWICFFYFNTHSIQHLLFAAILAALAFETRLVGVTVVITGGLLILLSSALDFQKKIKHFILFGVVSCSLISVNLMRNYILTSSLTGARQKGETPFTEILKYYGTVLIEWFPFASIAKSYAFWVGVFFLGGVATIFIYRYVKKSKYSTLEKIANTFTLVYSVFMLLSATFSKYETLNNRLLAPFFIPCLFTLSFYLTAFFKRIKKPSFKVGIVILTVLLGGTILFSYSKIDLGMYQENKAGGIGGYTDDDWVFSDALNYLKKDRSIFKKGLPVYSNASQAVYFYTQEHLFILPEKAHLKETEKFNKIPRLILIWLNNEDNESIPKLDQIKQQKNLTLLKEFKDGFIFQCSPK